MYTHEMVDTDFPLAGHCNVRPALNEFEPNSGISLSCLCLYSF